MFGISQVKYSKIFYVGNVQTECMYKLRSILKEGLLRVVPSAFRKSNFAKCFVKKSVQDVVRPELRIPFFKPQQNKNRQTHKKFPCFETIVYSYKNEVLKNKALVSFIFDYLKIFLKTFTLNAFCKSLTPLIQKTFLVLFCSSILCLLIFYVKNSFFLLFLDIF